MRSNNIINYDNDVVLETLKNEDLESVVNLLVFHYKIHQNLNQEEQNLLYPILRSTIIPAIQRNWSFVLKQHRKIIAVSIQIDLLDYLKIPARLQQQMLLEIINYHNTDLKEIMNNLHAKKGEYLLFLHSIICDSLNSGYKQYFEQVLLICKFSGWQKILLKTTNPYKYIKMNGKVLGQVKKKQGKQNIYLIQMNVNQIYLKRNINIQSKL